MRQDEIKILPCGRAGLEHERCYRLTVAGDVELAHESLGVVAEIAYQLERIVAGLAEFGECGEVARTIWDGHERKALDGQVQEMIAAGLY